MTHGPSNLWTSKSSAEERVSLLLVAAIALLFFAYAMSRATYIGYGHYASGSDEAIYIVSAQLLTKGFVLFRDVFSSQPAFFLPSLALVLSVVRNPILGAHIYMALCSLMTLFATCWLAWTAYRPLAGVAAMFLLAITPGFVLYSHIVVAESPMLAFSTLAVASVQSYYFSSRRHTAALAGILLMVGTEMKLLSVLAIPPMVLLLGAGAWRSRRIGRSWAALTGDGAAFAVCLVLPVVLILALYNPTQQISQVVSFHLAASRIFPLDAAANWDHLGGFLWRYDPALLCLGVIGAVAGIYCGPQRYLSCVYVLWFISSTVFLIEYHPEVQHQLLPLLPPLSLLGAAATVPWLSRVVGQARQRVRLHDPTIQKGMGQQRIRGWTKLSLVASSLYLLSLLLRTIPLDGSLLSYSDSPYHESLAMKLAKITRPNSFVVSNVPELALEAQRLMPPGLEDLSGIRVAAGYLTAEEAISLTKRYHPEAIIIVQPYRETFPFAYTSWLKVHYRSVPSGSHDVHVYVALD